MLDRLKTAIYGGSSGSREEEQTIDQSEIFIPTSNKTIECHQRWGDLINEASKSTTLMSIIPNLQERNELIIAALPTTVGNIVPLEQLIQQVVELATDDWQRVLLEESSTRLVIGTDVDITAGADGDGSEIAFRSKSSRNKFIVSEETLSTYSEKYPATDLYVLVSSSIMRKLLSSVMVLIVLTLFMLGH